MDNPEKQNDRPEPHPNPILIPSRDFPSPPEDSDPPIDGRRLIPKNPEDI
jgi:hypothetical protein